MSTQSVFQSELNRRAYLSYVAKGFLGVSTLPWATNSTANGAGLGLNRPVNYAPKAKNVIYLYMSGGMSHLDTLDPKNFRGAGTDGTGKNENRWPCPS